MIEELLKGGAEVRGHDPEAEDAARAQRFGDRVAFCARGYEALEGADALVLVTEWNEFRAPDFAANQER